MLPDGRGAGGREGEESEELRAACYMGLLSYLTFTPEVLRVSPLYQFKILNAVASSITQSGSTDIAEKPLTAAGLDGTGEVIQVMTLVRGRGGMAQCLSRDNPHSSGITLALEI